MVLFKFYALFIEEGLLVSPCYSLELFTYLNETFHFSLAFCISSLEENNRRGKPRDLVRKFGNMKGPFHPKMVTIKDNSNRDLVDAEEIKKRWKEHTEELYKKDLNGPDYYGGVVSHPEPDILEFEVKWALGLTAVNKASGWDGIPVLTHCSCVRLCETP